MLEDDGDESVVAPPRNKVLVDDGVLDESEALGVLDVVGQDDVPVAFGAAVFRSLPVIMNSLWTAAPALVPPMTAPSA